MSDTSELSSSPLSQLSNFHQSRSKLISMLRHFYEKLIQVILQSRLNTSQMITAQDTWFNILYQSEPIHLDLAWMDGLDSEYPSFLQPLTVEIILSWKHLNETKIYHNEKELPRNIKSVILERWHVTCDTTKETVIDTKSVYKYTCQYFRLLVAILKRLPSHNLLKSEKSKMIKRFGWHVTYNIYTSDQSDSDAFQMENKIDDADEILHYEMPNIETQLGCIAVDLQYRSPATFSMSSKSDLKVVRHRKLESIQELQKKLEVIIQDIPDPELQSHSKDDEVKVIQIHLGSVSSLKNAQLKNNDNETRFLRR
eukprot:NODE_330_length_9451_cov_0.342173.p4 type:complete len:311 gc:universal NODE_330_length_9451_cov_0.342173:1369-437(-)